MQIKSSSLSKLKTSLTLAVALSAMLGNLAAPTVAFAATGTRTPIKHVIIIVGENRSFDHLFATYQPVGGQTVLNLLSEGIIKADGTPGPNYSLAKQYSAVVTKTYESAPTKKTPYTTLPVATLAGTPATPYICQLLAINSTNCAGDPAAIALAKQLENGLSEEYYPFMASGGAGVSSGPDYRISYDGHGPTDLPPGPYQLTSASYPYDSYGPSPVHRFFQMFQQLDCSAKAVSSTNASGCQADLFAWVEQTVGAGSNGKAEPTYAGEGSTALGFYNVQQGDVPYFKYLADNFAMSDNYHQPFKGGTGANHIHARLRRRSRLLGQHGRSVDPAEQSGQSEQSGQNRSGLFLGSLAKSKIRIR